MSRPLVLFKVTYDAGVNGLAFSKTFEARNVFEALRMSLDDVAPRVAELELGGFQVVPPVGVRCTLIAERCPS